MEKHDSALLDVRLVIRPQPHFAYDLPRFVPDQVRGILVDAIERILVIHRLLLAISRSGVQTGLAGSPRGGLSWFSPDLSPLIGENSLERLKGVGCRNGKNMEYVEMFRFYSV
jgi:hypothetical protein